MGVLNNQSFYLFHISFQKLLTKNNSSENEKCYGYLFTSLFSTSFIIHFDCQDEFSKKSSHENVSQLQKNTFLLNYICSKMGGKDKW